MIRHVVDVGVVFKWFLPEIYAEEAGFLQNLGYQLHAPAFFVLEVGNVLCKKIRRQELTKEEGDAILEELAHLPVQKHPDHRLFRAAYTLARQTHQSLYDCMYLALAETIDGQVVTADRKFYLAIAKDSIANEFFGSKTLLCQQNNKYINAGRDLIFNSV